MSMGTRFWAHASVFLSVLAAVFSPMGAVNRRPWFPDALWYGSNALSLGALAFALVVSARKAATPVDRLWTALAALVACAALVGPIVSYFQMLDVVPWSLFGPALALTVIGGVTCRQRWLAMIGAVPVLVVAVIALVPPGEDLPRTQQAGDVAVTLREIQRNGSMLHCDFVLQAPEGRRVADLVDLRGVELRAKAGGVLGVECWRPRPLPREEDEEPLNSVTLHGIAFAPAWAPAVDMMLTVPVWPPRPALSVLVPVAPRRQHLVAPAAAEGSGLKVTVTDAYWGDSQTLVPPVPCIHMTVIYDGALALCVTDEAGHLLPDHGMRAGFAGEEVVVGPELYPIAESVNRVRVEAFSHAECQRNQFTLHYDRVPNRGG